MIRTFNDAAAVVQITQMFMNDIPFYRQAIEEGLDDSNSAGMAFAAHKLRGGLVLFGARSAARLAERLETIGNAGDLRTARQLVPRLRDELQAVTKSLAGLLQEKLDIMVRG
jgi:HPt (histidine-containing phosphotransfer) domain-containing protein